MSKSHHPKNHSEAVNPSTAEETFKGKPDKTADSATESVEAGVHARVKETLRESPEQVTETGEQTLQRLLTANHQLCETLKKALREGSLLTTDNYLGYEYNLNVHELKEKYGLELLSNKTIREPFSLLQFEIANDARSGGTLRLVLPYEFSMENFGRRNDYLETIRSFYNYPEPSEVKFHHPIGYNCFNEPYTSSIWKEVPRHDFQIKIIDPAYQISFSDKNSIISKGRLDFTASKGKGEGSDFLRNTGIW